MKKEMNIENKANIKIEKYENTKKSTIKKIGVTLGIILAIVVAVVIAIGVKVLVIGNKTTIDFIAFDTISVEDNKLILHGNFIDSISGCTKVKASEKDGVVTINIYEAPTSIFTKNEIVLEKEFDNSIDTIYIGEHIIYDYRVVIDKKVSKLYAEKTPYIGNISEVNQVINESGLCELFNINGKSLQITRKPYCLTLNVDNIIIDENEEFVISKMKSFSVILISCIDNLSNVNWKYKVSGEKRNYLVTLDEASNCVGENVKDIAVAPSKLQDAMEELNILNLSELKKVWED